MATNKEYLRLENDFNEAVRDIRDLLYSTFVQHHNNCDVNTDAEKYDCSCGMLPLRNRLETKYNKGVK